MAGVLRAVILALGTGLVLYFGAEMLAASHPKNTFMIGWLAGGIAGAISALLPLRR